jgi:lipopolysaccharide export system protein LptA
VTNGEAVVIGQTMVLKPKLAIISGDESIPVFVRLPEMPDLGYEAFSPTSANSGATSKPKTESDLEETVVKSRLLRMIEEPERTLFCFTEKVEVTATNLHATCDRLDVIAIEQPKPNPKADMPLEVQRIEAHDNVVVKQTGRTATGDKAFILPKEGKVILEGSAVVIDERGKVSGHRMILNQGQRRAVVEGGGLDGERARITLPALPSRD